MPLKTLTVYCNQQKKTFYFFVEIDFFIQLLNCEFVQFVNSFTPTQFFFLSFN